MPIQGAKRATRYFRRCGDLRAGKGVTKNDLARGSDVDRSTLSKIEAGTAGVTEEVIMRVFNCLNEKYYGGNLSVSAEITEQN